ncbi:MAG TPA: universal stress protein [Polyangiaceae bacterium]|jgi:nucleotide-binding universal stress UspA family protein
MSNASMPSTRPFGLLVALDLADTASGGYAVEQALQIVRPIPGSQLHVLHVSTGDAEPQTLGLLRHYVEQKATVLGGCGQQNVAVHVRKGEPAREIVQLAVDLAVDVIIVGAHKGQHLRKLLVGSTAEKVMAHATCPVLIAGPRPQAQPSHSIVIEGPCPDCVQARLETRGKEWWCARHSEHHAVLHRHHHIYSYHSELPFSEHDSAVSPTGVD